jgi:hypothetical protein
MKNYRKIMMLLLAAWVLQHCSEDESARTGKVQFDFSFLLRENSGGRVQQTVNFPEGSFVLLTVENSSGTVVYENKKIELVKIGDRYTTLPLDFSPGAYALTDFLILTPANEALYATPKSGSPLAAFVSHPLPLPFSIGTNAITNLGVEVVSADAAAPEDFGYAAFGIDVHAGPAFSLAVFISEYSTNLRFTNAKALVRQNGSIIHTQVINAKVTPLFFDGEPAETYTLEIQKEGYAPFIREFVLQDLLDELSGSPLSVVLSAALTFEPANAPGLVNIDLTAPDGSDLTIHWGDGAVQGVGSGGYFEHEYSGSGPYYAYVTGDIDLLSHLQFYYGDGSLHKLSIIHLTDLTSFSMGFAGPTPTHIDFSKNTKLTSLECAGCRLTSLDITKNIWLNHLEISATNYLSTAAIDKVINDLYNNATTRYIYGGYFDLWNGREDGGLVGPPSAAALDKLRSLRDSYGWEIYPTDF